MLRKNINYSCPLITFNFRPDPEKWRAIVREKFPVELIPAYWGGDLVTEDDYASGHSIWLQGPADMGPYMRGEDIIAI